MDAFYASVEQRDDPSLKGKPVAVGGSSQRGVVAAASYEARKFGVKSAMSSVLAKKMCPDLIFVKHRFDVYKEVSSTIHRIFHDYTDLIEPLSLDEAYLDVTENKIGLPSATLIAKEIKSRIKEEVNLTASAGISYNKFLAKIASDVNKPDGLFVVLPEDSEGFIEKLPIHKFFGIGKVTAQKMTKMGIFTGNDLKKRSLEDLSMIFGKSGGYYYNICRGIDNRQVNPSRDRKSVSAENTFENDLTNLDEVFSALDKISTEVHRRITKSKFYGKTLTIKIKYGDFHQITRSKTISEPITKLEHMKQLHREMFTTENLLVKSVRLLGLGISNQIDEKEITGKQLTLDF